MFLDERMHAISEARYKARRAQDSGRSLTALETEEVNRALDHAIELGKQAPRTGATDTEYRGRDVVQDNPEMQHLSRPQCRAAYRKWLMHGWDGLTPSEVRDISIDGSTGGYLTQPVQAAVGVLTALDDLLFIRRKGTVLPPLVPNVVGDIPTVDTNIDEGEWTTEINAAGFDASLAFGNRQLPPHDIARAILVSQRLLMTSSGRAEAIVNNRLAYAMAVPMERAYMTGDGSSKPLGIFTADASGISTGRDISTGSTTTAVTGDSFVNARFNVKSQYQERGEWVLHRDTVKAAMLLKDSSGRFIFEWAEAPGDPDMIVGKPVNQTEYAPNTFTAGLYVGIFGDLSFYWITDLLWQIGQDRQSYARNNQTVFIAHGYTNGIAMHEEAFTRMKLASA